MSFFCAGNNLVLLPSCPVPSQDAANPIRPGIHREPIPTGETYQRDPCCLRSRNTLVGRSSPGDYDRDSGMGAFSYHTCRLTASATDHAPGEIDPVQDRVPNHLVDCVVTPHITALDNTGSV